MDCRNKQKLKRWIFFRIRAHFLLIDFRANLGFDQLIPIPSSNKERSADVYVASIEETI